MVGDSIILLTGIIPLVLVGAGRAVAGLIRRGKRDASGWYELSLVGAAAAAGVAGSFGPRVMAALGGYRQSPVGTDTDLSQLQHGSWVTLQAFLEFFGANVFDPSFFGTRPALEVVFVAVHLAGAVLAIWALGFGPARVFGRSEPIVPVFASAWPGMQQSAQVTFGRPTRTYHVDGYTILVWNTNVLVKLDAAA